jgi:hypothetical protein
VRCDTLQHEGRVGRRGRLDARVAACFRAILTLAASPRHGWEEQAMEFRAFEPAIEVLGQTVWTIVDAFDLFKEIPSRILIEEGVGEPGDGGVVRLAPAGWYSQEAWLRAFKRIAESVGESKLYAIGLRIPENAKFPPHIKTIDDAVASIDVAYHMNHRKAGKVMFDPATGAMLEGIGHYGYKKLGPRSIESVCANPYPCSFDRGIITTMARRFEKGAAIVHDDTRPCRRKGQNDCTYKITW